MNLFLVVNFYFLCCLLAQRGSCLKCFGTRDWKKGPETAIGFDESKLLQITCDAGSACFIKDHYTDGELGKFN